MSVPVYVQEAIREVTFDYVSDLTLNPSRNAGPWVERGTPLGVRSEVRLKPYSSRLFFDHWTPMRLPDKVPVHTDEDIAPDIRTGGSYHLDYYGKLNGSYTVSLSVHPYSDWLGVQTAVFFGVLTVDPDKDISVPSDWSVTVDLHEVFQWSVVLLSRQLGNDPSMPHTWLFKYLGQMLPNPGKITIGFKLFGQTTPEVQQPEARISFNATLTSMNAQGELAGSPAIRADDPESDLLSTYEVVQP